MEFFFSLINSDGYSKNEINIFPIKFTVVTWPAKRRRPQKLIIFSFDKINDEDLCDSVAWSFNSE